MGGEKRAVERAGEQRLFRMPGPPPAALKFPGFFFVDEISGCRWPQLHVGDSQEVLALLRSTCFSREGGG